MGYNENVQISLYCPRLCCAYHRRSPQVRLRSSARHRSRCWGRWPASQSLQNKYASQLPIQSFDKSCSHEELTLLADKRQTPCENVHEVGQPIRVRTTVELSDVHDIVFVLQHSSLVVVHIQIIGRRKNGNQWGETCRLTFSVHAIPGKKEGSTSSNQILIVYLFLDRLTQRLVLHELELWIISYFAVENHSWLHNCNQKQKNHIIPRFT